MSTTHQSSTIPEVLIDQLIEDILKRKLPYPPRLTKYEIARIIAARAKQLAMGAKPLIDVSKLNTRDPVLIAFEEFKQGKLPFIIVRTLPSGRKIEISLSEMQKLEKKLGFSNYY